MSRRLPTSLDHRAVECPPIAGGERDLESQRQRRRFHRLNRRMALWWGACSTTHRAAGARVRGRRHRYELDWSGPHVPARPPPSRRPEMHEEAGYGARPLDVLRAEPGAHLHDPSVLAVVAPI